MKKEVVLLEQEELSSSCSREDWPLGPTATQLSNKIVRET